MMKSLAITALLLGVPVSAQHVAGPGAPLAYVAPRGFGDPAVQDRWIPFVGGNDDRIVIPIMLNGERVNAMVDTGAPDFTVDRGWSARHGIAVQPYQNIATVGGGTAQTSVALLSSSAIGGTRQVGGAIVVADVAPLAAMAGIDFQAIVGADFLWQFAIEIDFDHRRIRFRPSGTTPPPGRPSGTTAPPGVRVPIRIRDEGRRFITSLAVGPTATLSAMIDTGDDGSLAMPARWMSRLSPTTRLTDVASIDLSGRSYVSGYARLDDVRWGAAISKVPAAFNPAWFAEGYDGRIGLELLRRFNVLIDAKRDVMVLSPRVAPPQPAPVSMTGIQGPSTDAGLTIAHVMKGSPAEAMGLHTGDRICAVDGEAIRASWTGTAKTGWGRGPAGKTVALTMCDARRLSITLREFY